LVEASANTVNHWPVKTQPLRVLSLFTLKMVP